MTAELLFDTLTDAAPPSIREKKSLFSLSFFPPQVTVVFASGESSAGFDSFMRPVLTRTLVFRRFVPT